MAAQIDIINLAMTHLGCRLIGSIQEASEGARRASVLWSPTRDEVLRDYAWSFATMIQPLTVLSDSVIGWNFLYGMPPECIRVRRVFNAILGSAVVGVQGVPAGDEDFLERPGRTDDKFKLMIAPTLRVPALASNLASAYAEYTYRVSDPATWDPKFAKAMSFKLAAELCRHLVGNPDELQAKMENKYLAAISDAGRVSAAEGNDETGYKTPLYDVRGS